MSTIVPNCVTSFINDPLKSISEFVAHRRTPENVVEAAEGGDEESVRADLGEEAGMC